MRLRHSKKNPAGRQKNPNVFVPYLNLYEDEHGSLWMGTFNDGIVKFNPDQGVFERYVYDKTKKNTISSNRVFSLTGDGRGQLFLGTENGGLSVLDLETGEFSNYTFKLGETGGITSNSIYALYYSRDDILWLGTFNGGINYASRYNQGFRHYNASKDGLNNPYILSLAENKDGDLWIGTDGGGLNYFDHVPANSPIMCMMKIFRRVWVRMRWRPFLKIAIVAFGLDFIRLGLIFSNREREASLISAMFLARLARFKITMSMSFLRIAGDIFTWARKPGLIVLIAAQKSSSVSAIISSNPAC